MSFEEAEVLRERAGLFLENAKYLVENSIYDLAAFNVEQYCRLMLKYKLLIKTGTYPRTHALTRLANELAKLSPEVSILLEDEGSLISLTRIEDAYIGSRYLPRRYTKAELSSMLRFVEEVFKPLVERV